MTHLLRVLALAALFAAAACTVTGTAPPSSADADIGNGLNYIGEPGSGAP